MPELLSRDDDGPDAGAAPSALARSSSVVSDFQRATTLLTQPDLDPRFAVSQNPLHMAL